jgi:serine/threonine-protein kinase
VADGAPVDWAGAESRAESENRRLVGHLRLVERIASLHRSIPLSDTEPEEYASDPTGPRWGRLVLFERIGHGTSGEVFRAWDTALHRDVALKLLHDGSAESAGPKAPSRLLEEARRLARVRHSHVVHVYGAERHDDRVGLWMELVRGESLEQSVKLRGPFGPREAALIGLDLSAALAAVHAAGLLHRDLKAQNVMREEGGRIVLMDFGTGEERSGTNRLVGTPLYLAPEIFRGQKASVQSDLYSLGVLLYYLVTGKFPVVADSMSELARAHSDRRRRPLRDLRPDAPEAFVRAVERALDSDPIRRYRSAGDMEAALREAIDTQPASQAPPVEIRPAVQPRRARVGLVAGAIAALLVVAAAAVLWTRGGRPASPAAPAPVIASVAVLPLVDQSETPSPHLAEALTDQLIDTVGQISSIRVTSRSSVMSFRGGTPSARDIARTLGVDALLESSMVRVVGGGGVPDKIRVNARLVLAGTDSLVWARSFERQLGDMLALQAEIAHAVASGVNAIVTPRESRRFKQDRVTTAAAEEAYLVGRYHLGRYGLSSAEQALDAFTRATELDPSHAAAFAGAARARFALGFGGSITHADARARALADVQRALRLDADQPDAHAAMGDIRFYYDWDWKGAESEYHKAIELNPSFTYARSQYARYLAAAGHVGESVAQATLTAELDPLSAEAVQTRGLVLYYARDYAGADEQLRRALTLEPGYARAHRVLARVREAEGRFEDGIAEMHRAIELAKEAGSSWHLQLIRLYALAGRTDEARTRYAALTREMSARGVRLDDEQLAYMHLGLGDTAKALDLLERAVEERQPALLWLAVDPRVDPIRSTSRFSAIQSRLRRP